jgi:hypothetical protein
VRTTFRNGRIAGLAVALGGGLLVAGGFLPWAVARARGGGAQTTVNGWSLGAVRVGVALGAALLVLGAAMVMISRPSWRRALATVSVAAALGAAGIAVYHLSAQTGDIHAALRHGSVASGRHAGGRHAPGTSGGGTAPGTTGGGTATTAGLQRSARAQRGGRGGARTPGAGVWVALAGGLIALSAGIGTLSTTGGRLDRPLPGAAAALDTEAVPVAGRERAETEAA